MSIQNCWLRLHTFLKREDGPTAVEYAVMLALIVVICLTAVELLGRNSSALFQTVAESIAAGAE
jgi:pilus assembly protein Flp/PilA